jgi:hypothetical protein
MEFMSELLFSPERLNSNILKLNNFFENKKVKWSLVLKLLGNRIDLLNYIDLNSLNSIASDNVEHLNQSFFLNPNLETWYIGYDKLDNSKLSTSIGVLLIDEKDKYDIEELLRLKIIPCFMLELDSSRFGMKMIDFNKIIIFFPNYYCGAYLDCMEVPSLHFFDLWKTDFRNGSIIQSISSSSAVNEIDYIKKVKGNHFRIGELAFFGGMIGQDYNYLDLDSNVFTSSDGSNVSYTFVNNWIKNNKLIKII